MNLIKLLKYSNPLFNKMIAKYFAKETGYPKSFSKAYYAVLNHLMNCYKARQPVILTHHPSPVEIINSFNAISFIADSFSAMLVGNKMDEELIRSAERIGAPRGACSFQKSIIGLQALGLLPRISALTFLSTNQCDSPKKVFEHLSSDVPGFFIDAPYSMNGAGINYMTSQLNEFIKFLEMITGRGFNKKGLNSEIDKTNTCIKSLYSLINTRKHDLIPVKPLTMYRAYFSVIGYQGSPGLIKEFLDEFTMTIKKRQEEGMGENKLRLALLQLPPFYPSKVFNVLEENDCAVVWDELPLMDYELSGHGVRGLAKKYLSSIYNKPLDERIKIIIKNVKEFRVDGVIYFSQTGCRQSNASVSAIKNALINEGIPMLILDIDCLDKESAQQGQIVTRLESFMEMLK